MPRLGSILRGGSAPWYMLSEKAYIQAISISDSITKIGSCAFYRCSADSVHLPESLAELGHDAFYGSRLTSVSIPDGVSVIPKSCFSQNTRLETVKLPAGLKTLDYYAFCNAPVQALTLPDGLETIGESAFWQAGISSLVIPESVHTIEARPSRIAGSSRA